MFLLLFGINTIKSLGSLQVSRVNLVLEELLGLSAMSGSLNLKDISKQQHTHLGKNTLMPLGQPGATMKPSSRVECIAYEDLNRYKAATPLRPKLRLSPTHQRPRIPEP